MRGEFATQLPRLKFLYPRKALRNAYSIRAVGRRACLGKAALPLQPGMFKPSLRRRDVLAPIYAEGVSENKVDILSILAMLG